MTVKYTTTHGGETASRTSQGHLEPQYTHAIWVLWGNGCPAPGWSCEAYTSRYDLAVSQRNAHAKANRFVCQAAIAPVTAEVHFTKRQRAWLESLATRQLEGAAEFWTLNHFPGWKIARHASAPSMRFVVEGPGGFTDHLYVDLAEAIQAARSTAAKAKGGRHAA